MQSDSELSRFSIVSDSSPILHRLDSLKLGQIKAILLMKKSYCLYIQFLHLSLDLSVDDDGDDGDFSVNPSLPKKELLRDLLLGHRSQFRHVTGFFQEE
jgi:hypothetical protein